MRAESGASEAQIRSQRCGAPCIAIGGLASVEVNAGTPLKA
jgi:hypothetical protein